MPSSHYSSSVRGAAESDAESRKRYQRDRDKNADELDCVKDEVKDLTRDVRRLRAKRDEAQDALNKLHRQVQEAKPTRLLPGKRPTHRGRRCSRRLEESRARSAPVGAKRRGITSVSTTVWSLPPQSQLHFRAKYVRRVRERSGNAAVSAVGVTGQPVKADSLS